jgi:tRNA (guanine37-N1)-methyltransferase
MSSCWKANILSIFPQMFPGPLGFSNAGRALEEKRWSLNAVDLRDFALDKHKSVDDEPFGGGAGMVMKPDVLDRAINDIHQDDMPLIYLTPRGKLLNQSRVHELAEGKGATILCGRFEGVDQRVLEKHNFEEICIGDYILSGGESAAIVLLDSVIRLLPNVTGKKESLEDESFERGLLEYPHYTRPQDWEGRKVPEVLISGHHQKIADWRNNQSVEVTKLRRPDLYEAYQKTKA